jgi:hypothetical protein
VSCEVCYRGVNAVSSLFEVVMRRKVVVEVGFEMVDIFKHLYLSSGATWRIRIVKTGRRKKDRANYSSDRAIMHRED